MTITITAETARIINFIILPSAVAIAFILAPIVKGIHRWYRERRLMQQWEQEVHRRYYQEQSVYGWHPQHDSSYTNANGETLH